MRLLPDSRFVSGGCFVLLHQNMITEREKETPQGKIKYIIIILRVILGERIRSIQLIISGAWIGVNCCKHTEDSLPRKLLDFAFFTVKRTR